MAKYETAIKLKAVKSLLAENGGAKLLTRQPMMRLPNINNEGHVQPALLG